MEDQPIRLKRLDRSEKISLPTSGEKAKEAIIPVVVDRDSFGELMGVEIINVLLTAGSNSLDLIRQVLPAAGAIPRYGFDDVTDSFYLHLKEGRSATQESVRAAVDFDANGRIIAIDIPVAS